MSDSPLPLGTGVVWRECVRGSSLLVNRNATVLAHGKDKEGAFVKILVEDGRKIKVNPTQLKRTPRGAR